MKERDVWLDLVRGLSAILVMLGHLRGFIFVDFGQLQSPSIFSKLLYFSTGLGHQAVMVFFVLSGYFVGGSVLGGLKAGRFRWSGYAVARLSRLWVVLVPALLVTLVFDQLGSHLNPSAYAGEFGDRFMSGPRPDASADNGFIAGLGNLLFLQTIVVPVYGSNGPLWSLANEFWYYVLFPLLAVSIWSLRRGARSVKLVIFQLTLFVGFLFWIPHTILQAGAIWLLGVAVWILVQRTLAQRLTRTWLWRVVFGLMFFGALVASKTDAWFGIDLAVGLTFALWMPSLIGHPKRAGTLSRLSVGVSEVSYTLYVVHFPMLFFIAAVVLNGHQFHPNGLGLCWYVSLAVGVMVIAAGMWWLFERNTSKVRRWVVRGFRTPSA